MKLVVVGAQGTLGARLATDLAATGVDFRANAAADDPRAQWREAVADADVVVNVGGPRVRPDLAALDYFREHVGVAQRVVAAMRKGAHLVHVSSTAVFGARGVHLSPDSPAAPERFPMPDYAAAKLAAETYVRAEAPARGLGVTVLRPSMVYGPGVDSALESLRKMARRGVGLALRPASLRQHLVHIDLFVAAVRAAAQREPVGSRPLLVADPFVLTNADLDAPARVRLPVPLTALGAAGARLRRFGRESLALDSFAVLALDVVFDTSETWDRLGLSRESFDRRATFDRYFVP